jgi:hypothetical protein
VAFRRLSLSNLGRSGVLLIGRLDAGGGLVLTVTAATKRPVQLRLGPDAGAAELSAALAAAIPDELYHDDIHGLPDWRKDMTYRLAEAIRAELAAPAATPPARVSGDFWPPQRTPPQASPQRTPPQASEQQDGA